MSSGFQPYQSLQQARDLIAQWREPLSRYERHLSAVAMLAGFGIDNVTFGRIDRPAANIVFAAYLALAAGTIAILHRMQSRADKKAAQAILTLRKAKNKTPFAATAQAHASAAPATTLDTLAVVESVPPPADAQPQSAKASRLRSWLPAATQFALGGLWSGFLVFYSRSAVIAQSWPFLLLLTVVFLGNEVFRRYRDRLVFTGLLLFFALYSWAIFVVPVLVGHIGSIPFAISGIIAIGVFLLFLQLLKWAGRERFRQSRLRLLGGAIAILAAMNLFYFAGVLPPLPLALSNAGVFHSVKKNGAVYTAVAEPQPWLVNYNLAHAVMHVSPGEPLSVYSAVFAPIRLSTRISHRWQWYDPKRKKWLTQSVVTFPINGGREGGYRGYSIKSNPRPGSWRVDIDSDDKRLIGRVAFDVDPVPVAVPTQQVTIQ